jgi:LacI family transcriptional regulator
VINGGSASLRTRERVQRSIAKLGFSPTPAAQGLATRRASTVGLVVNSTRGSWFSELIAGVEEALVPSRRSVLIASLKLTGSYDQGVVKDWIRERRVDGLLFVRCSERERPLLRAASSAGIPVALIAPDTAGRGQIVARARNVEGGQLIAQHLLELGHRRIAFVGGPKGSRDTKDRLRGITNVLAEARVRLPAASIWFGQNYYPETGVEYAKRFLRKKESARPTAVVFANDAIALGFAKALLERGLRIPEDVSIAGFDDSPEAGLFWPGLTSVAQPSRQIAAGACQALLDQIDDGSTRRTENFLYDVHLVVRESCAAPPGRAKKRS